MNNYPKVLIFFGAGASFGSDSKNQDKLPPLGKDLFKELKKFSENWAKVDLKYQELFETNFELGMKALIDDTQDHRYLQRDLARYFYQFKPIETNIYCKLANKLAKFSDVGLTWLGAFVTLNYDRLLPLALENENISVGMYYNQILNVFDHNVKEKRVEICYPHGMCQLYIEDIIKFNIKSETTGEKLDMSMSEARTSFSSGYVYELNYTKDDDDFEKQMNKWETIPLMSYYEPNKRHPSIRVENSRKTFDALSQQEEHFKELVLNAQRIIIIGVAFNPDDTHIWEPLAKSNIEIIYVEPGYFEHFSLWALSLNKTFRVIHKDFENSFDEICQYAGLNVEDYLEG